MMTKSHYAITLSVNPFPLMISLSIFNLVVSMLLALKFNLMMILILSLTSILQVSLMWWNSYSKELTFSGTHTNNVAKSLSMSMLYFITSEVMFFSAFFWGYFHFALAPALDLGLNWPPLSIQSFDYMSMPLLNTLILLSSGIAITLSHQNLLYAKELTGKVMLIMTIILGIIFTVTQKMEYDNAFFSINDSTFGSSFFMLTGFHGIHVMLGTMFLAYALNQMYKGSFSKNSLISFELSSWYWHFVDVVWMFLFYCLYYLNE